MKFLADMGISPQSVIFLRQEGYNAIHLSEQQLHRLSDTEIINKVKAEGRIILTHDLDFGNLMAASGDTLPSIVLVAKLAISGDCHFPFQCALLIQSRQSDSHLAFRNRN